MKFIFVNKSLRFLILIFSFLLPFVSMNTFSVSEDHQNLTVKPLFPSTSDENNLDVTEKDKAGVIAQNIQTIGGLLSSSSSQLTEQAKSYALGRVNGVINSEVQEWLSQFGTARVNLSLDRKGKLHNSSLDLLFPLYDNKVDWLVFSQLGYRNKDSRNTVNLGFGSRYFTSGWMYGFNTFFDQDITGKNNRLGLGAEAWADYLKLSANTYIRLSKWHQSRYDKDWEERPANGFDINGEFFLPAYPHIGSKLGYEKYFGDNVTLFNRDTKQKNPGFAKVGITYTPIPLITMGIDYRHGSNKHSDARFQANLNYRFGVPLSVQLSPDSVASMRTLAGSRYDLVERNNNIVLDHREKPRLEISVPNIIQGRGAQELKVEANVESNRPAKPVKWTAGEEFYKNGGVLPSSGNSIRITLPRYLDKGVNSYPIHAMVELENGKLSRTAEMTVKVTGGGPFEGNMKVSPDGIISGNGKDTYTYKALILDEKSAQPLRNHSFENVTWSIVNNKLPDNVKFKESKTTTDGDGYLTASLVSNVGVDGVEVKMELTTDDKKVYDIHAERPVSFKAVPQSAGLRLISDHHQYSDLNEQNKPYNVFNELRIQLRKTTYISEGLLAPISRHNDYVEYESTSDLVKVILTIEGPEITFPAENFSSFKKAIVTATVTEFDTGAKYSYEYKFNPQRYVFSPNVGNVRLGNDEYNKGQNHTCKTLESEYRWSRESESVTEEEVGITISSNTSLEDEYSMFDGFGFLPFVRYEGNEDNMKIKVKDNNESSGFYLIDYGTRSKIADINSMDVGRLLCKLKG
ncbi:inverse autotransporter beta domain-containing protein [Xenorhabdus sp. PB61.4]|uniref:inverse autotransporter beta domain-containing protein n=1 Tax=Xenorhabdus sp. PB61.4 TaxID=2788940 RepID=UPI001E567347|nr:inverse autotransporter beta domain-containing protein [Xenorhabdus sp. PB61.4]MCC8367247.1 inverse autotransporter beta domain-containing protein [Xenorhabdus sp. PB61.4]